MVANAREEHKANVKSATESYLKEFLTDLGLTEEVQQMQINAVVDATMKRYDEEQRSPREKYLRRLREGLAVYLNEEFFTEDIVAFYGLPELRSKMEQHFMDLYDSVHKKG